MELGKNKLQYYGQAHKEKKIFNKKILIFSGFVLVIGAIIFTTLYSNGVITGNVISFSNPNSSIIMSLELTPYNLNLKGEYSEIEIFSESLFLINLSNVKFLLLIDISFEVLNI